MKYHIDPPCTPKKKKKHQHWTKSLARMDNWGPLEFDRVYSLHFNGKYLGLLICGCGWQLKFHIIYL